ncbi:MAG TPA: OsmC family protein [Thermoanaerobaculia bacterium]|nr:OsmC family protein [Thermoanaerobaculia bacterium]
MQAPATAELELTRTVDLEHIGGFRFLAHFGEGYPAVTLDEPPPLGSGAGPDAARLLAAAIGDCLSASLLLCLQKSRVDVHDLRTNVTLTMARNDAGRLRIGAGKVRITLDAAPELAKLDRCAHMFEDYCIVTATVRRAFPISVEVVSADGREIYRSQDGETT